MEFNYINQKISNLKKSHKAKCGECLKKYIEEKICLFKDGIEKMAFCTEKKYFFQLNFSVFLNSAVSQ